MKFGKSSHVCILYSVSHNFIYPMLFAGNQGNHQNFIPSLVCHKLWLIWIGMKGKKIFFEKKKNQIGQLKKTQIFTSANFQYFFVKISWIGPWVSRIDWCEENWCGSTYMAVRLSNIFKLKNHLKHKKMHFLLVFELMSDSLTFCWATLMPFASINPTNPRTSPWNFWKKILRIGGIEKLCFFESAILDGFFQNVFFLLLPNENQSTFIR